MHVGTIGMPWGWDPPPKKNTKTHIFSCFGASKATTAMGEAIATDSLSMGPILGMGTPFSSMLMFSGPGFVR